MGSARRNGLSGNLICATNWFGLVTLFSPLCFVCAEEDATSTKESGRCCHGTLLISYSRCSTCLTAEPVPLLPKPSAAWRPRRAGRGRTRSTAETCLSMRKRKRRQVRIIPCPLLQTPRADSGWAALWLLRNDIAQITSSKVRAAQLHWPSSRPGARSKLLTTRWWWRRAADTERQGEGARQAGVRHH